MGYKTNSYALRLNVNRGWRTKAFTFRKEGLSMAFLYPQLTEFFEDYFNKIYLQEQGVLFSHLVFRPAGRKTLYMTVFISDPSVIVHAQAATDEYEWTTPGFIPDPEVTRSIFDPEPTRVERFKKDYDYARVFNRVIRQHAELRRRVIYRRLARVFRRKFRKLFPTVKFRFRLFPLLEEMLDAGFYAKFILMKFLYREGVAHIVNPISKRLLNRFNGFRIDCFGRFDRRQRASLYKFRKGTVSFNTFKSQVDYSQVSFPMKFGACSIRVWLGDRLAMTPAAHEIGHYFRSGFHVHRFPRFQPTYEGRSIPGSTSRKFRLRGWGVPLRRFKSPFGKTKLRRLIPRERYKVFEPYSLQYYNRRVRLLRELLSRCKSGLSAGNRSDLTRMFLGARKKSPSWFRSKKATFRTPTRVQLEEQISKDLDTVREEAPANLRRFQREERRRRDRKDFLSNKGKLTSPKMIPVTLSDSFISSRFRGKDTQLKAIRRSAVLAKKGILRKAKLAVISSAASSIKERVVDKMKLGIFRAAVRRKVKHVEKKRKKFAVRFEKVEKARERMRKRKEKEEAEKLLLPKFVRATTALTLRSPKGSKVAKSLGRGYAWYLQPFRDSERVKPPYPYKPFIGGVKRSSKNPKLLEVSRVSKAPAKLRRGRSLRGGRSPRNMVRFKDNKDNKR